MNQSVTQNHESMNGEREGGPRDHEAGRRARGRVAPGVVPRARAAVVRARAMAAARAMAP